MNKFLKKTLSLILCMIMLFGVAPLNGIAELDFSKLNVFSGLTLPSFNLLEASSPFETKASAEETTYSGECGQSVSWSYDEAGGTLTISGEGRMRDFYSAGGSPWSSYNDSIETVDILSGVTSIGSYAFCGCAAKTINIPDSVSYIGKRAFKDCIYLENVNYNAVELADITNTKPCLDYRSDLFGNAGSASENGVNFIFRESVRVIPAYIFCTCDYNEVAENVLKEKISQLGNYGSLFGNIEIQPSPEFESNIGFNLKSVKIPLSVQEIGDRAFFGCSALESVTYGAANSACVTPASSPTSVNPYTKEEILSLFSASLQTALNYMTNLTDLANSAIDTALTAQSPFTGAGSEDGFSVSFEGIRPIVDNNTGEIITDDLTGEPVYEEYSLSIPDGIFKSVTALTEITIDDNVASIGESAFENCSGIVNIAIPKGVNYIYSRAFADCESLENIEYDAVAVSSSYLDIFYGTGYLTPHYENEPEEHQQRSITITFGNDVRSIPANLFNVSHTDYSPKIGNFYFSENISNVGQNAFYGIVNATKTASATWYSRINKTGISNPVTVESGNDFLLDGNFRTVSDLFNYRLNNDGMSLTITGINPNAESIPAVLTIPSEIEGLPVVAIGDNAFSGKYINGSYYDENGFVSGVENVIISDGIEEIGSGAFAGMPIRNADLPESLISIADGAFMNCEMLVHYALPSGLTSLGAHAFENTAIEHVKIPVTLADIGNSAFAECASLDSLTILNGVEKIGEHIFENCISINEIVIPESVVSISPLAFSGCYGIDSLEVDELNQTYYSEGNCIIKKSDSSLIRGWKASEIPEGVTSIGSYAFAGAIDSQGSASYMLPFSVTSIGESAFYDCGTVALNTFQSSSSIESSISIDKSNTNVELYKIYYNQTVGSGSLFGGNSSKSITITGCDDGISGKIVIPETIDGVKITTISDNTFKGQSNIKVISLPSTLSKIGKSAFVDCTGLTEIFYDAEEASLYRKLFFLIDTPFSNSGNKKSGIELTFGDSVKTIPNKLFYGANIKSISIGKNVSNIGTETFANCQYIESIVVDADNATFRSEGNCLIKTETFILPPRSTSTVILGCANSIIPNDIEYIGASAFEGCYGLRSIVIPSSVTSIGKKAFYGCTCLDGIEISDSVRYIGESAFEKTGFYTNNNNWKNCVLYIDNHLIKAKTDIQGVYTIKDTTISVADSAFSGCTNLVSIDIPDNVKAIGSKAFYNVLNISYSSNMTATGSPWGARSVNGYVDGYLVYNDESRTELRVCSTLASGEIRLPDTVKTIKANAFYNCTRIETIDIPNSVTSIGENAFYHVANIRYSDKMTATGSPWGAKTVDAYIENGLVYYDETKAVLTGCLPTAADSSGNVTVPATVAEVGDHAFTGCDNVTSVTFSSAEIIDFSSTCFADCDNLLTVTSPNTDSDGITYMLDEPYNYHIASNRATVRRAAAKSRASDDTGVDFTEMNGILFCNREKSGEYQVPERIRYICENAFANCVNLTINLDNCNLKKIGKNAFFNSGNYKNWDKSGLFTIGNNLISAAEGTTSLTVPSNIKCIASGAFENFTELATVSFSGNSTYIGKNAFAGTAYVNKSDNWSDGALYIGNQLVEVSRDYSGAFAVKSGTISIASGAFSYCSGVTAVTIPDSVTDIGENAFEYCYNLESVSLGSGVEEIGNYAFRDCDSLSGISIPASVEKIGDYAFMNCNSLTTFNVADANDYYSSADGILFSKNGASLIQYPAGKAMIDNYDVDSLENCERIESLAFRNCKNIGNVKAAVKNKDNPDGTIKLGYRNPFAKSSAQFNYGYIIIQDTTLVGWTDDTATTFTVPDGITEIGANAFEGKTKLTSIIFNNGLREIGDSAFIGCTGLTEIVFPASLQKIGNSAFENCENLNSVNFTLNKAETNTNLIKVGICAFAGCADGITFENKDSLSGLKADNIGVCAFGHEEEIKEDTKRKKDPTCTEAGLDSVTKYCDKCGKEHTKFNIEREVPALGHSFTYYKSDNNATCKKDGTKTAKCERCNETDTIADDGSALGHSFTSYVYNNDATADKDGTETAKCDRCEKTDTLTVEGSSNLANYIVEKSYADDYSSCTIVATNNKDASIVITETVEPYEITVTEPTCTKNGSISYKYAFTGILASLSGSKTVEGDSATGHSFINYVSDGNATCLKDGTKTAKCDHCDTTDTVADKGSALGHSYTDYVYNNDATIEKNGTETAKCDRCDETNTRTKPGTRITASGAVISVKSSETVDYRSNVTVIAYADNVPEGYFIAIYDGNNELARGDNKSVSYKAGEMTASKTFTVKVIDSSGNIQKDSSGNQLQKNIEVKVKSGFFDKLIAFFKKLFNVLPEIEIKPLDH